MAPQNARIPYPCGTLFAANLDSVKESLPAGCDLVINLTPRETPGGHPLIGVGVGVEQLFVGDSKAVGK